MKKEHDLAKWLAGEMTGSELKAFENSPEFETYNKIKEFSSTLKAPDFDEDKMYQDIVQREKKKTTKEEKTVIKLQSQWFSRIAAVLVLAVGLTFLIRPYLATTEYASAGEKKTFLLPDNSEVILNSGSEIAYKKWNWDNKRSLKLEGEAFFKVAKGKRFDVNTNLGKVTVVGTQFNIKSRDNNFEVECYEGKVKVAFNNKSIFLTKGQNIVVQNGVKIETETLIGTKPSWLSDEIKFNNNSLEDIIGELERQYNIKIDKKAIHSDESFTGALPMKDIEKALEIVSKTYRFNYKKISDKKVILTSNDKNP